MCLREWAWILVLIPATIGWGSAIALDVVVNDFVIVWFDVVPLLMVYASLLLSTRETFPHNLNSKTAKER